MKKVTPSISPLELLGIRVIAPLSLHDENSSLILKFYSSSKASSLLRSMRGPVPRP